MSDNPCYGCDCWDSDREGCTMPSVDRGYACRQTQDQLRKLAESMPYSMFEVNELWREWEDFQMVKTILEKALVSGTEPVKWSITFDGYFSCLDRTNSKAMAELWVIILQEGWY